MSLPPRLSAQALDPLGFTQDGRVQVQLVLRWFDLSTRELECIVDRTTEQRGSSVAANQLVVQLAFLANAVTASLHSEEKSITWFRVANPMLGGVAPLDMIALGRIDRLERWIEGALQSFNEFPM